MNTNELADRLVDYHDSFIAKDCATMLRQLQAENEALKAEIDRLVNHSRTWTPFD